MRDSFKPARDAQRAKKGNYAAGILVCAPSDDERSALAQNFLLQAKARRQSKQAGEAEKRAPAIRSRSLEMRV
jgi:hypothetical protein